MGSNRRTPTSSRYGGYASRVSIKVDGLKELDAALGEFSKATARSVTQRALIKAAGPMVEAAKRLAPDDPVTRRSDIAESITVSARSVAGDDAFAQAMRRKQGQSAAVQAKRDALRARAGDGTFVVYVGPARKKGLRGTKIAHLLEYGVGPHVIKPRKLNAAKRLSFTVGGDWARPGVVHHPGIRPQPFMRPAFEETKEECLTLIASELRVEITKAADRARRRALRKKG
jgi:HK97 gp10 family phage protein